MSFFIMCNLHLYRVIIISLCFSHGPSGIVLEGNKEPNSECRVDDSIERVSENSHCCSKKEVGIQVYSEHWMDVFWTTASRLRDHEILCDITLSVGTSQADLKIFQAHKIVLVCASEYFYSCLCDNNLEKNYHFESISEAGMDGILKFIYRDHGSIQENCYRDVYHAACVLSIPMAKDYFQSVPQDTLDNGNGGIIVSVNSDRISERIPRTVDTIQWNVDQNHEAQSSGEVKCINDHAEPSFEISHECQNTVSKQLLHTEHHDQSASSSIHSGYRTQSGRITGIPSRSDTVLDSKPRSKKIFLPACNVCGRRFLKLAFLRRHKERQHLRNRERRVFRCDVCPKVCRNLKDIKLHKRKHTGKRPFLFTGTNLHKQNV